MQKLVDWLVRIVEQLINGELRYKRRSCSLIDETRLKNTFGNENRVILGFNDISDRKITSATLSDGQTDGNEVRYGRKRKTRECRFIPCQDFIYNSRGHNEVSIECNNPNGEYTINMPSYVLVVGREPTQIEIDVAAEFNIPIRRFNLEKYNQVDWHNIPYDREKQYSYTVFTKKSPTSRSKQMQ